MKNLKKIISALMCMVILLCCSPLNGIVAFAATSGTCGENATWNFDSATGTLTISGSGEMDEHGGADAPWQEKKDKIHTVRINSGITSISGFADCSNLKTVTIPNSVIRIGYGTFMDCVSLSKIVIPDSVVFLGDGAFMYCENLESVYIGSSVESITNFCFSRCVNLKEIVIPDSVLSIGDSAFLGCENLQNVVIGNGVNYIGEHAFADLQKLENVKFGKNLKTIEDSAFNSCTALTSVSIPDSVVIIGKEAFMACENVNSIKIGNGVKTIGENAFEGCWNATSLSLGKSVETISDGAFELCHEISNPIILPDSLVSVGARAFCACGEVPYIDLGNGIETIGEEAFGGCAYNSDIFIPVTVKSIGSQAFFDAGKITVDKNNKYYSSDSRGVLFNKDKTELIQYPRLRTGNSYTVPSTVTKIGDYAFYANVYLEKVILSNSLKTIGSNAFAYSCIKELTVPDSVTEIGESAFYYTDLEKVALGSGLTSILEDAFYNCNKITEVSYAGSSAAFSAVDVKAGNEAVTDNYSNNNEYQTQSIDWAVMKEILKKPREYSYVKVIVKAIDKDTGKLVEVPKAEVCVKDGDEIYCSEETNENGVCNIMFNNQIFVQKLIWRNLKVSANYELDNGLYLCSETINSDGYWIEESLNNYVNKEMVLIIDEPRWHVPKLRVLVNESNVESCKKILKEYSALFAQATNGHVVVNDFEIIKDTNDYLKHLDFSTLEKISSINKIDICMVPLKDKQKAYGYVDDISGNEFKKKGSISAMQGSFFKNHFKDNIVSFDGLIFCSLSHENISNVAQTLCHESGHYLLGFLDEYAAARGALGYFNDEWTWVKELEPGPYSYDYGDKIITVEEYRGSYWGHALSRPNKNITNYGLMEHQDKCIEMSTKNMYIGMNGDDPEKSTIHYYYSQASCEEKLAYELSLLALKAGYKINYSYANKTQTATYSFAGGDNVLDPKVSEVEIKSSTDLILNSDVSSQTPKFHNKLCAFNFSDSTFNITSEYDVNIAVNDILGNAIDSAVLDESNGRKYSLETTEDYYDITVSGVVDGVSYSNRYSVRIDTVDSDRDFSNEHETVNLYSETEGKAAIISPYNKEKTVNGEYTSVFNEYIVCAENNENVTGHLSSSISRDLDIDYSSLTWFYKLDDEWVALDTYNGTGEHFTPESSCAFAGNGTYCLMAKSAVETVYSAPTDVTVSTENVLYDNEVNLAFNDTNENILHYNIYYGTEPVTPENCFAMEKQIAYPEAKSANITLPDSETTYYFAVQAVGYDGGKSVLSECVTGKGALVDSDGDGLPDCWVNQYPALLELEDIPGTDSDEDGLTNLQEYNQGTNPLNPDTDGDNVYDGTEIAESLSPLELMSDGVTDDYIVVYGNPDVEINTSSFTVDEENVICTIENNGDGKAMRTFISLYNSADELILLHEVNIDSNSYIDYKFSKEYLADGVKIVVDEDKITRDSDYANNEFTYNPVTSITATDSEQVLTKSTTKQLEYTCNSSAQADILTWESSNENVLTVDNCGNITCKSIGEATVTVTTSLGYSCSYNILVEPFEGVGLTDFDCQLINDGSAVEITGYVGDSEDVVIPAQIADISVVAVSENAFVGNTEIASIAIHSGITSIGTAAFNGCSSITDVYYDSSRYCFNKIAVEAGNDALFDAKIHCAVIPATAKENVVLDCESGFVYGLSAGLDSLEDYTNIELDGYQWEYTSTDNGFGTGTTALLTNGETVMDGYTVVIFGDVNGDGWYDAEDAFLVNLIVNGLLTEDKLPGYMWTAADCNHDGLINEFDVELLMDAGVKKNDIDQNATQADLVTQTAYIEYASLIDQSAGMYPDIAPMPDTDNADQGTTTPGTNETVEPSIPAEETDFEVIFANIFEFIKKILSFIFSFII